jgi:hypothetical protein
MGRVSISFLIMLVLMLGPLTALVGHYLDCGWFDDSSSLIRCESGERVSDDWFYLSLVMSSIPLLIIIYRYITADKDVTVE